MLYLNNTCQIDNFSPEAHDPEQYSIEPSILILIMFNIALPLINNKLETFLRHKNLETLLALCTASMVIISQLSILALDLPINTPLPLIDGFAKLLNTVFSSVGAALAASYNTLNSGPLLLWGLSVICSQRSPAANMCPNVIADPTKQSFFHRHLMGHLPLVILLASEPNPIGKIYDLLKHLFKRDVDHKQPISLFVKTANGLFTTAVLFWGMKTLTGGKKVDGTLEPFHSHDEFRSHMLVAFTPIAMSTIRSLMCAQRNDSTKINKEETNIPAYFHQNVYSPKAKTKEEQCLSRQNCKRTKP